MRDDWHWIFLTVSSLAVSIGAMSSDIRWLYEPSVTDWVIAAATIAGVVVAAVAATFLYRTLKAAESSNEIIAKQLRAHRPFLICEGVRDANLPVVSHEVLSSEFRCKMAWRNYGSPPALNVKITAVFKESVNQPLDRSDVLKDQASTPGTTIGSAEIAYQQFYHGFSVDATEGKPLTIRDPYISVVAVFRDSHSFTHIVEHGFEAHLVQDRDNGQFFLKLKQAGPDNFESVVE